MSVDLTVTDAVAYITLNDPPYNILTGGMMDAVSDALDKAAAEPGLKAVAFRARGKAFSAGADVGEHSPEMAPVMIRSLGRMIRAIHNLEVPVVMAADGAALGAGFELLLMADVLLATDRTKLGLPEVRLGFFAPVGAAKLPALVGPARAAEIACTGRTYTAAEMQTYGVVTRVLPADELEAAMESVLGEFRLASPVVLRMNVRMFREVGLAPFLPALERAEQVFLDELMSLEDVREGVASFTEKRKPVWKNA